jgi:antitoxin component YwqK of YwqJK toxin-antitoxin module
MHRGTHVNGKIKGYWENYKESGKLESKKYYIL